MDEGEDIDVKNATPISASLFEEETIETKKQSTPVSMLFESDSVDYFSSAPPKQQPPKQ